MKRLIELCVDYYHGTKNTGSFIRYEWFGLKNQTKRIKNYVYLEYEKD